jgi:type I restriction enzyme S subunit
MKWFNVELSEVCEKITDGSHRTPNFVNKGYPFVTVTHVDHSGNIDFSLCSHISEEDYRDLVKNGCRPLIGDVLFSKDGTVGKVAVIDFDQEFVLLSSLAILRPKYKILFQK